MPSNVGHGRAFGPRTFYNPRLAWSTPPSISGITKDSTGAVLGSCTVKLYETATDLLLQTTISDAVTGAYAFFLTPSIPCYVVAYKVGAPDVTGVTLNTLVSA